MSVFNSTDTTGLIGPLTAKAISTGTFIANTTTRIAGLAMFIPRDTYPAGWDQAGWLELVLQTTPSTRDIVLDSRLITFNLASGFLFPRDADLSTFFLRFTRVDHVPSFRYRLIQIIRNP